MITQVDNSMEFSGHSDISTFLCPSLEGHSTTLQETEAIGMVAQISIQSEIIKCRYSFQVYLFPFRK